MVQHMDLHGIAYGVESGLAQTSYRAQAWQIHYKTVLKIEMIFLVFWFISGTFQLQKSKLSIKLDAK